MGILKKENLDLVLVPSGLLIMFVYHLTLLYRYHKCPHTTEIGFENNNKKAWVQRMMKLEVEKRNLALSVLSSNISAATSLSSISLVLSSLIGAWIGGSNNNFLTTGFIYGDTRSSTNSIKYVAILSFFLLAFACFIQTTRHFVHCSFLLSNPICGDIPTSCVETAVIRGSNFWAAGLRALYFAITLLMWIFGPIPLFVSSIVMVAILHVLDRNTTPMIQYTAHQSNGLLSKIGQELTSIVEAFDHHDRDSPEGNGGRVSGKFS